LRLYLLYGNEYDIGAVLRLWQDSTPDPVLVLILE